jgi:hypothetical protein
MKTSDAINELATALAAAQAEMKNAPLNKTNPHFKSRYADLAGIRDTVTPALTRHGIAIVQGTDTTDSGIVVVTRLIHKSGQWMESRFPISYDKPQAMGSAYTYARRYSLSAMCAISADEDDDANAANDKPVAAPASATISAEQFRTLADLIEQTGTDEAKLLTFVKGDSLETLNVAQFRAAETALRKKMATPKAEAA